MPQTRKYANSRSQARRPNNQAQRRQQPSQQNQQPSNNQHPRQPRVIESGDQKPDTLQPNNGPITRASSNKHVKSEPVRDEQMLRQEQLAASVLADDREKNLAALHKDMEEILDSDVYCAICREVYVNPIILNCSHSFCKFCLTHWLNKQVCCPSCRMAAVFQTENLALRNTISKMITSTSAKYKKERENLVKVRLEAEAKAQEEGLVPLMEKKEAELAANDLGFRTRNNGRRRRVIGQWKGPNGATIWRTSVVGDKVISHNPEETSDSSGDSEEDNDILEIAAMDPPIHFQAERVLDRIRVRRAIQMEEFSDEEQQRAANDILSLYNGDFRDDDSDSNDSEFVAPEVTTSDEEFEHRMSEIESLDEDLSTEVTDSSNSDTSDPTDSEESQSEDESDSTDTEISEPADVSYEQSDHDEIEENGDSEDQSVIIIDDDESDDAHHYLNSSDSMDWNDDSGGASARPPWASPGYPPSESSYSDNDSRFLYDLRVNLGSNESEDGESDDSY